MPYLLFAFQNFIFCSGYAFHDAAHSLTRATYRTWLAVGEVHTALLGPDQRDPNEQADGIYIAPREARKRFQQFLRTETRSLASEEPYSAQLLRQPGSHRKVDIDLKDIKNYDGLLGQQLEETPNTCLPLVRRKLQTRLHLS
jgi:hypothetical protein